MTVKTPQPFEVRDISCEGYDPMTAYWKDDVDPLVKERDRFRSIIIDMKNRAQQALDYKTKPGGMHAGTPKWAHLSISVLIDIRRDCNFALDLRGDDESWFFEEEQ